MGFLDEIRERWEYTSVWPYAYAEQDVRTLLDAFESFRAEHEVLRAQRNELRDVLAMLFDKWEGGVDCFEGDDGVYDGPYLGKAFLLTEEEENRVIAALKHGEKGK